LSKDEDDLERIWKSEYALNEFLQESNFKTYDELKTKLNKVLGLEDSVEKFVQKPSAPKVAADKPKTVESSKPWTEDEDEDLSYFEKLAEED
jgi:hypothetical protein